MIPGQVGMVASGVAVTCNIAQGDYCAARYAAIGLLGIGIADEAKRQYITPF